MYIYDIGYGTFEESHFWQYSHEKKFTNRQIELIVGDCIFEVIDYLSRLTRRPTDIMNWVHFLEDGPNFQDLMEKPKFHKALQKRGFKPMEFEAKINLFGWASSIKNNWKACDKDIDVRIRNRLKRCLRKDGIYIKTTKEERKGYNGEKYIDENYKFARKENTTKKSIKRKK